jgi:hypothetical protein
MNDRFEIFERKMKKPKRPHANKRVAAFAGNTKVETPDDSDNSSDTTAFVISSSSKTMIQSILSLFDTYDRISTQHKIDNADAINHDIASSHIRMDFNFVKLPKSTSTLHKIAIVERGMVSKGITCTTLRDFMESRTTAVSYQRVLRMAEMVYEQMTGLEARGLAPPYYGLEDILVINESFFCFINDAKLFQIESAEHGIGGGGGGEGSKNKKKHIIYVTRAISRTGAFFAPELIGKINALPYPADVRSSYYSYGLLVAYCATLNSNLIVSHEKGKEEKTGEKEGNEGRKDDDGFGDRDSDKDSDSDGVENEEVEQLSGGKRRRKYHDNKNQQHQKQQQQKQEQRHQRDKDKSHSWQVTLMRALAPLQYTKLYWLILRCCDPDVSRRSIIYI